MKKIISMLAAISTLFVAAAAYAVVMPPATYQVKTDAQGKAYWSAVVKSADRIVSLQNANGSFDWVVTGATGPTATTYYNITGVTAESLLDAYKLTNDTKYLDAAKKAGDYIKGTTISVSQRQNAYNAAFLYDLATVSGDASYSTQGKAILDSIFTADNYWAHNNGNNCSATTGCTADNLLAAYISYRGAPPATPNGIVAWDLAPFVSSEVAAGDSTTAGAVQAMIDSYVTKNASYTATSPRYTLGLAAALRAKKAINADATVELAALVAAQKSNGSFEDDIQSTAYALMALNEAGDAVSATKAADYLAGAFGYDSGSHFDGWKDASGDEYGEVDGEAGHALAGKLTPGTFYTIADAVKAAKDGDTIAVMPGTYTGDVVLDKAVTLTSTGGAAATTIAGQVTVNVAGTTVSNLTVTNPNGNFGVLVNGVGSVQVTGNTINAIGTGTATGNVYGIYFQDKDAVDAAGVTIQGNTITGIGAATNGSNGGIGIGDSTGTSNITGVVIDGNTITGVTANPAASGGKGAYGIIVNHASGSGANTGTAAATITNNTISTLSGKWAHAIGLEGNTPSTTVTGNTISGLTSSKTPQDAAAFMFESNASAATVTLKKNKVDSPTVAWGVVNATTNTVDANANYWNTDTPGTIMYGTTGVTPASIIFSPWYSDADLTKLSFTLTGAQATTGPDAITGTVTVSGTSVSYNIPAGTTITGSPAWDGVLKSPVATSSYTLTPDSGTTATAIEAIEIGAGDTPITFDKGVRLLFAGQKDKLVGWSRGGVFTQVSVTCPEDSQAAGDMLPSTGDCKMNVGADLVVWTRHFTSYVVYTQSSSSSGGSSGGSGGGGGGGPIAATTISVPATAGTGTTTGTAPGKVLGVSTKNTCAAYMGAYNVRGSRGAEVLKLQKFLNAREKAGLPETGYFGDLTFGAVRGFQAKYGINPRSGNQMTKTTTKINELYCAQ